MIAKLKEAEKSTIDQTTFESYETTANELEAAYNTYTTLECSYADLAKNDNFVKFCLENRLIFATESGNFQLNGFEIRSLNRNSSEPGVYIPKWSNSTYSSDPVEDLYQYDEKHGDRSKYLDENGYIALDSIGVSGIGNGAFQGHESFTSIELPASVKFIGNDAFNGCTFLNKIDLKNIITVGNRAFKGCIALKTVVFSDDSASSQTRVLGAEAFYDTKLSNGIVFPETLQAIGRGCFAESDLTSFRIQQNNQYNITIWPFAFYNCTQLGNTGDGTTENSFFPDKTGFSQTITIGMAAFAVSGDSGKMSTFEFPHSMQEIINTSAGDQFGLDALENTFSSMGKEMTEETYYDYILAGRSFLNRVVFPYNLGISGKTKIPDNTLRGCKNLESAVFGEMCLSGTNMNTTYDVLAPDGAGNPEAYDEDNDGEALFADITNTNFFIEGPGYINRSNLTTSASPRLITAKAQTAVSESIPYIFLISDNPREERIEMSHGDAHDCLAILEVISDTTSPKEVRLVEYKSSGNELIKDLVINSTIGNYRLTELGEGCFANVKDKVIELIVEDGSVSTIEANAFSGSNTLQKVTLGNSVKVIGEGAFSGCSKLENVYFSSPKAVNSITDNSSTQEWADVLTIGDNAFNTGSTYLTFHGDIHSGYAPYELAMSGSSFGSNASGRTICYKTDAPRNLTVIYDHQTGFSTLIDYPHYEELDTVNAEFKAEVAHRKGIDNEYYSIKSNFEGYNGWKETADFEASAPEEDESALIAGTYNIEIPDGVQSIDVKSFIQYSKNSPNVDYLYISYEEKDDGTFKCNTITRNLNGSNDLKELYSNDNSGNGSDITNAGLFSGYFIEVDTGIVPGFNYDKTFNGKAMHKEEQTSGNDQLLEVSLTTIEKLPSYAFESCENLNSVSFGTKLATLGNVPFRGCESLTNVSTANNPYFTCESAIIYHLPSSSADSDLGTGYVIEECLGARGNVIGYKSINSTTDPLLSQVSGIKPEAFSYCPDIQTVDLSDTSITVVPEECFRAASTLKEVVLPESVSRIDSKAFSETTAKVTIYSTTCQIESDAFDEGCGIIRGYKYTDGTNTKYSTAYQYAQNHKIQFEAIDAKYTLMFLDYDGALIDTQYVDEGKDGKEPEWTPTRTGYTFKEWSWENRTDAGISIVTGDTTYRNVNGNRIILATYSVGNGVVSDGNDYTLTIEGGKNIAGETKLTLKGGTAVSIIADEKSGTSFQYWSESVGKYAELFEEIHSSVTTFVMPNENITITANFVDGSSGSGSGSGSSGSGSGSSSDSATKYQVTVNYGSGSGEYAAGETVSISAFAPESSSKVFSKWTSTNTGVGFVSATSSTTTFTMPASAVTVTANYKTRTSDDEEDEELEALNRRKGTSTATVTTGTNNATVTTTTGTVTNTATTTTGDNITITKDGISNTGVASTNVEGATDNFVVKITDSDSAVAEAEAALRNKYGSLDGILYFPMDITLYDVTGKNEITDTTGLNVTVTIPIPDEMIQYGGNVRAAAIENGQLEDLNVRFTTIDGIACMSFVPPHFSPYVIYVDTNNLVAGQMLDATPKTGDPIHPKWFLAMGMACLSVILFTTGDKKKKIKLA